MITSEITAMFQESGPFRARLESIRNCEQRRPSLAPLCWPGDPGLLANGPRLARPFAPAATPIASALSAPKEPIFADWERA